MTRMLVTRAPASPSPMTARDAPAMERYNITTDDGRQLHNVSYEQLEMLKAAGWELLRPPFTSPSSEQIA